MDYFQRFIKEFRNRLIEVIFVNNAIIVIAYYIINRILKLSGWWEIAAVLIVPITTLVVVPWFTADELLRPTRYLWQAIMHIAPGVATNVAAPKPEELHLGRELITNLVNQVYQLASAGQSVANVDKNARTRLDPTFASNALPLPLLVLNKENTVVLTNDAAAKFLGKATTELTGQNIYTLLDMSFTNSDTLDNWLKATKGKTVTADRQWERVRIGIPGQSEGSLLFDLAAHYNQDNPMGYETILVLFDHTKTYIQEDDSLGFVALSVHELRTPLTLLRGYIEVFDEEVGPNLEPELQRFMKQMDAAAQQLTAFVDNILNVAKIEDNQLTLQLHEEKWSDVIDGVINDMRLRAGVRTIIIKTDIANDLPTAGADRYSIYELLSNLLDNAIKYSKPGDEITVKSALNKDGLIETSVVDSGVGIDGNILPHIFDKFYRNHSTRAQIGGTGLGLYLAKAIVEAHGGQIWVNSKAGEGSSFTFTILPYAQVKDKGDESEGQEITRSAHGWIKNHSLYRD